MTSSASPNLSYAQKKSRALLYIPLIVGALIMLGYGIIWRSGASVMRTEIDSWVTTQRQAGMTVAYEHVKIGGFPFFLRATISHPALKSPDGWAWHGPKLFIDASPLQPDRLIFAPRGLQEIILPTQNGPVPLTVASNDLLFSLKENYLAVEGTNIHLQQADITLAVDTLRLNIQQRPDMAETILSLDSKGIQWQGATATHQGNLPLTELVLSITALPDLLQAHQTKTYDRWRQAGGSIRIDHFKILADEPDQAPPTQLSTTGTLSLDPQDYPTGSFDTRLKDPIALTNILMTHEVIAADQGAKITHGITAMTKNGGTDDFSATLTMHKGKLKLGPLAITNLPKLQ